MAENPTKGGVHHSAFLSRKTAPAAPSFHIRNAKVVKNRAENQPVNISSHSAKNRYPTPKSPRIPHVTGDCVRRRSNNLLGQFRKITTDFRRTFSHKIPLASHNHLFPTVIGISENDLFLLTLYPIVLIPPNELHQLTRIYRSKQTFFDFFLKTGVTFPIFSSLIYETRLVAVAERHTRSDCGLYLLDTIYICIKFIGAPIVVPRFTFLPSNLPFSIRFLNQEFASKESKSVCGYQSFRMRWLICG